MRKQEERYFAFDSGLMSLLSVSRLAMHFRSEASQRHEMHPHPSASSLGSFSANSFGLCIWMWMEVGINYRAQLARANNLRKVRGMRTRSANFLRETPWSRALSLTATANINTQTSKRWAKYLGLRLQRIFILVYIVFNVWCTEISLSLIQIKETMAALIINNRSAS